MNSEYNRLDLFWSQKEHLFLKLLYLESQERSKQEEDDKGMILRMSIYVHGTKMTHEKSMYNVFDLIGDVGGLLDIFLFFFAIFF